MGRFVSSYLFDECSGCNPGAIVTEASNILARSGVACFVYIGVRAQGALMSASPIPVVLTNALPEGRAPEEGDILAIAHSVLDRGCASRVPLLMTADEIAPWHPLLASQRDPSALSGVLVPIFGPGGELALFKAFGRWRGDDTSPSQEEISDIRLLSLSIHATVTECIGPSSQANDPVVLSAREKECLALTAQGKTAWEISAIFNRSRGTVNFHLRNAMQKLDAVNKTQAVAKAIQHGLLAP